MSNFILGLIAMLLLGLFFGFYLVKLHSVPLAIIFVGVFALAVIEFIGTNRKGNNQTQN